MSSNAIAAIATPPAQGGIGIVRISGDDAIEIADRIFRAKRGVSLTALPAYSAAYGHVYEGDTLLDECIALVFRGPKSYTGENVAELSCHGGLYILRRVLACAVKNGARFAQPGEFTKRAFLNGRIDLTRAEAVMELIGARGEKAAAAAIAQQEGALFTKISDIKKALYELSADICAFVDFPEEDHPELDAAVMLERLGEIQGKLDRCLATYEKGRLFREGIATVIAGRPNVGKSTLMNLLAGTEKSIVTEVPGTTRDVIEESIYFAGNQLNLIDTAGLRETGDEVERIGVRRAGEKIESAELVLAVFDASKPLTGEDRRLIERVGGKRVIAVLNKCDLEQKIDEKYIDDNIKHIVKIVAKTGEGIEALEAAVSALFEAGELEPGGGILANERQLGCARRAREGIAAAIEAERTGFTMDAVSTGVEQAVEALGELTGERAGEEIIARVFEKFCVGK